MNAINRLDFGEKWFGIPCSAKYWGSVRPIFDKLKEEKAKGTKWSELEDKDNDVYVPLLQAFIEEVKRAYESDASVPQKMVEYLIGDKDSYETVSYEKDRLTLIYTFNIHGTLNQLDQVKESAIHVPGVKLPTELVALKFKTGSSNTVEMYLNNGWEISFRIHSAKTVVEPSLKFDVEFLGMPCTVLSITCKWN